MYIPANQLNRVIVAAGAVRNEFLIGVKIFIIGNEVKKNAEL